MRLFFFRSGIRAKTERGPLRAIYNFHETPSESWQQKLSRESSSQPASRTESTIRIAPLPRPRADRHAPDTSTSRSSREPSPSQPTRRPSTPRCPATGRNEPAENTPPHTTPARPRYRSGPTTRPPPVLPPARPRPPNPAARDASTEPRAVPHLSALSRALFPPSPTAPPSSRRSHSQPHVASYKRRRSLRFPERRHGTARHALVGNGGARS